MMSRPQAIPAGVLAAALGLAACQPAPPVPPPSGDAAPPSRLPAAGPGLLHPDAVGTVWEYRVITELPENAVEVTDDNGQTRSLPARRITATKSRTIEGAEDDGIGRVIKLATRVNGDLERIDYRRISPSAIADLGTDLLAPVSAPAPGAAPSDRPVVQVTYDQPVVQVPWPLETGASWSVRFRFRDEPLERTFDALGEEDVVVPAGAFRAWRIRSVGSDRPGHSLESTVWFVSGVGFIKSRTIHTAAFGLLKDETEELVRPPAIGP